ncbi:hypothetical protein Cgig2_017054 [Carnegiea gigantea]|uniref:Transposase n=1 Tax=Carnegiea gigantea TaxID=171969 RepID=A0A9Q1GK87_9CARY|nr:hypothetical protein Cgig2_017054 [Carnegiea gigantea]
MCYVCYAHSIGAKLHPLFSTASNTYTEHVHKQAIEAIMKESVDVYKWLFREPVENWARYTFPPKLKCPNNTTNFVESFNGKIEKLRHNPIFTLLEEIRRKFMKTTAYIFKVVNCWTTVMVSRVKLLLVKGKLSSRECLVTPARRGIFEERQRGAKEKEDTGQKRKVGKPRKDEQTHVTTSSTQLSSQKRQTRSSSR